MSRTPTPTATVDPNATPTATIPPIGPTISAFGVASANGAVTTPIAMSPPPDSVPIYLRPLPQGFIIFAEAKPGLSNRSVGKRTFNWSPNNPNVLPDFQIWSSSALGADPTANVCDAQFPDLGGVPALPMPIFGTQATANIINDLSCRFDDRQAIPSSTTAGPCTRNQFQDYVFADPNSTVQFCTSPGVGREIAFPRGDTRLWVRAVDTLGNPGFPRSIIIRVP